MVSTRLDNFAKSLIGILASLTVIAWTLGVLVASAGGVADWLLVPFAGFNFLAHETGHWLTSFANIDWLEAISGTLIELSVVILFCGYLISKRTALGYMFSGAWLGFTFINIARYMADAPINSLKLYGLDDLGGHSVKLIHDWQFIFSRLDVLSYASEIAITTAIVGLVFAVPIWIKGFLIDVQG